MNVAVVLCCNVTSVVFVVVVFYCLIIIKNYRSRCPLGQVVLEKEILISVSLCLID